MVTTSEQTVLSLAESTYALRRLALEDVDIMNERQWRTPVKFILCLVAGNLYCDGG